MSRGKRRAAARRNRSHRRNYRDFLLCQVLEQRVLMTVVLSELGTLTAGREYMANESLPYISGAVPAHKYTFTIDAAMDFQAQLNIKPDFFGNFPHAYIFITPDDDFQHDDNPIDYTSSATGKGAISDRLAPGSYILSVNNPEVGDLSYDLAINLDAAKGDFFSDSLVDYTTDGLSLGALRGGVTQTFNDFIGYLHNSNSSSKDLVDTYKFSVGAAGNVSVTLDQLAADPAGGLLGETIGLYRDFDHDGIYAANELVASKTGIGGSGSFSAAVSAGDYAVIVTGRIGIPGTVLAGGSNYRLRFTFTPPDTAGATLGTAKDLGTVGAPVVSSIDYLTGGDTDFYKFTTQSGGPFQFDAMLTGSVGGSTLALIRDANGNGQVDGGETIATANVAVGSASLSALLTTPGTYFVRAQQANNADGAYTLAISSTNTDRGGNTFATATNIGNLFGKKHITDFVSANDTVDFYKFSLIAGADFDASFPATQTNTDAVLALYQDLDNDGMLDKGEELTRSDVAGNGGEAIFRSLSAGTYIVGVWRNAGSPAYDLTIQEDVASFIPAIGQPLALDGPDGQVIDYTGPDDVTDYYKLNVTTARQLNIFIGLLGDATKVAVIRDSNQNLRVDAGETLLNVTLTSDANTVDNHLSVNLPGPDTYFLRVSSGGSIGTNYGLVLATAPIDNAGNTPDTARDLGVLTTAQSFGDFVGSGAINATDDVHDYYRFTLGDRGPYQFIGQVPGTSGQILTQLIEDKNNNGVVDSGEVLATTISPAANVPPPPIVTAFVQPGTYFYHVQRLSGQASYGLSLQAISIDAVGNTMATALPLNATASVSEFVGNIDRHDFYRFTATAAGEATVQITGANSPGVGVEIVRDLNNNGLIDPGESLATTIGTSALNDSLFGVQLPAAGVYFVHVMGNTGSSGYTLSLNVDTQTPFAATPFVVDPTVPAGVRIQVEDFDRGGEGVAYHDFETANLGGAYRPADGVDIFPTTDAGGGFRVDLTNAGEFMEYSLNVLGTGNYNLSFRTGTIGTGAKFHAEIDGVDVTGSRDVPGGLAADTFATVLASNVLLTAGPHLLRLVVERSNSSGGGGGGAYNFIQIAPSTGTFSLPAPSSVPALVPATLSLGWTVPAGSWHVLQTVDIRLSDANGIALWVRYDVANKTLSLFNEPAGKFGPAKKLGSKGVLSNGNVQIDLSASSIIGGGPIAPTVTFNLAVTFHKPSAGRHLTVEASASNTAGFDQAFDIAGTLDVL